MTKILVTGGTGFLGKHLVKALREKYNDELDVVYSCSTSLIKGGAIDQGFVFHSPPGVNNGYCQKDLKHFKCDLIDAKCVKSMFFRFQPDVIFHLAAIPIVKIDEDNPTSIIDSNIKATQHLLHYCPEGCRFIFASSIVVYGTCGTQQFSPTENDRPNPTSIYGVTKLASEGLIKAYSELRGIDGLSLRLPATVGTGLTHGVIHDFIAKLRGESETLDILGDCPGSTKPYLYIEDAVRAFVYFAEHNLGGVINIVPKSIINIKHLASCVKTQLGINKEDNWLGNDSNWKGDNPVLRAGGEKASMYGWQPQYNSTEAVKWAVQQIVEEQQ